MTPEEKFFRRWEPYIEKVLDVWPTGHVFTSTKFAPATIETRVRMALASWRIHHWPLTSGRTNQLHRLCDDIEVRRRANDVWAGPKHTEWTTAEKFHKNEAQTGLNINTNDQQAVDALLLLFAKNLIPVETILQTKCLVPMDQDVWVERVDENTYILR